jgi:YesN/AraC family two-component response regulator
MEKIRILVVDDEPTICNMVLRFLSMNNYEGDSANNGKEALKLLESKQYHIVLTDIKMPEMDGIALMRTAKSNQPELVFVIMSDTVLSKARSTR